LRNRREKKINTQKSKKEKAMKKVLTLMMALLTALMMAGCEDDSGSNNNDVDKDIWIGKWLSTGSDVAVLLATYFQYDSVRVEFKEDMSIVLETHVKDGAWTTQNGIYAITKSTTGNVHAIDIDYTAFVQSGIIEFTEGTPDEMRLEAVQTTPNIGATPRTVETGFGSDATLGTANIQKYIRIE